MRKTMICILCAVLALGMLWGCGSPDPSDDEVTIDKGNAASPTYTFTEDGILTVSDVSRQQTINRLSATDDFGRSFGYIDGFKEGEEQRYVGLFYFTWLGYHGGEMNGIYDVTKLIDTDPDALWAIDPSDTDVSPLGKYHFWGEPLYGYYNSRDPWVIRHQMELFTLCGIDFIAFDCTNGFDYIEVVSDILPIMQEMYDEGWNVPKFMFYLNTNSRDVIEGLYSGKPTSSDNVLIREGIYKNGHYRDLWFAPEGKPKIAAITDPASTNGEGAIPSAEQVVVDPEILDFFDFWESTWPNNTQYENGLPWMDWNRPQNVLTDTINVSVAQHNHLPFSDALLSAELADTMWGRGYTKQYGPDHSDDAIDAGLNFEEEWSVALEKNVKYTFVTGWNEWVAIKNHAALGNNSAYEECRGDRVYFVDTVNREYSRDIEMMKGGYGDTAFLQLMRNTRALKGREGSMTAASHSVIDIAKGMNQWAAVSDVYYDVTGAVNRNFRNFSGSEMLVDDSVKNDIAEIRVAQDENYLYFLIVCEDDIVPNVESSNWMNLLIDVEGVNGNDFYGYDFVINRQSSYTGECSVERYDYRNGQVSYDLEAKANFTLGGRYMQFRIAKADLDISGNFRINFKVADNVTDPEDIQSYYISGDVAPVGRLNYIYQG